MITQEMEGLKQTIEEQKKIIEEKQMQCENLQKTHAVNMQELETKIKQTAMNVRI